MQKIPCINNIPYTVKRKYLVITVDKNNEVLKYSGDPSAFLFPLNFNVKLTELLPRPLAAAFKNLSIHALKTNSRCTINGINIKQCNLQDRSVNLSVTPVTFKMGANKYLKIIFSENRCQPAIEQNATLNNKEKFSVMHLINLEEEVKELKMQLASTKVPVQPFNESVQSFNVKLLLANDKMQSTNQQMQFANDELHTINDGYHLKNKELLELNENFDTYLNSNIDGQLFVNSKLQLIKYSKNIIKQLSLLQTDIGRPLNKIIPGIKFKTIIDDVKEVIANGIVITKELETHKGKWYQVTTMPYVQKNNKDGAVVTFNNITGLKKMQVKLTDKNKSLLRINADLDNFVYAASHDLLGPLGNIELSIAVMNEMKVVDPALKKILTIINSSVQKFRMLISDIAVIAKTESDMMTMEIVNVEEIINDVEWSLENDIKATGAIINRDIRMKFILFSKANFRSIIYNLLSNSIKFKSNKPPVINIKSVKEGDNIIVSVQDNGIGIAADKLQNIFGIYQRLNEVIKGSGIGLFLSKKIIDAANGNIIVESEPGKGSTFSIHLKAIGAV